MMLEWRKIRRFLCMAAAITALQSCARAEESNSGQTWYVNIPVADLRSEKSRFTGPRGAKDKKLQTQILKGEKVQVLKIEDDFASVEVPNQSKYDKARGWIGYPGWIAVADISRTPGPTQPVAASLGLRQDVLKFARSLKGVPYLWGGRSPNGVDCSGLIHLAFTLAGHPERSPRDSVDMFKASSPLDPHALLPGDLIFTAHIERGKSTKEVFHVMMYIGDGQVIEAPATGMTVREISFKERTGSELLDLERKFDGEKFYFMDQKHAYYFGTLF